MTLDTLPDSGWRTTVERLGGAEALAATARSTKAFCWGRQVPSAVGLLRSVLAYCSGERGLRSPAAWAAALGVADLSNVGLLYRLRRCGDWLSLPVGQMLAAGTPKQSGGRLIRIVDATTASKAGRAAKRENSPWRIHGAFDPPCDTRWPNC